ncbi:MAG: hypothetical protein ACOC6O_01110 [Chloroflexota bacterium]
MATPLFTASAGAGIVYYPVATDINLNPHFLAERLAEKGAAHFWSCF